MTNKYDYPVHRQEIIQSELPMIEGVAGQG